MTGKDGKRESLARPKRGLSVAPSPFNSVKLDLAVILILAVVLELLHGRIASGLGAQFALLAGYAVLASGWLVWRTRRVLRRERERARRGGGAGDGA